MNYFQTKYLDIIIYYLMQLAELKIISDISTNVYTKKKIYFSIENLYCTFRKWTIYDAPSRRQKNIIIVS